MKILLHVCCAPCALGVLDRAAKKGELTLFFYNPNIFPDEEYVRRLDVLKKVIEKKYPNLPLIESSYDEGEYLSAVSGFENEKEGGKRCERCIELRMRRTAKYAKENGFDAFTTTLSVSPHKSYPTIAKIGKSLEKEFDITFIDDDFKKKDGFLQSTRLSKEMGIYRQKYCGCRYSINDERDKN